MYPEPQGGASLLLSWRLEKKSVLIIGGGQLAASRAFAALEADSSVVVLVQGGLKNACEELCWRAESKQITIHDLETTPSSSQEDNQLESYLSSAETPFSLACVTDLSMLSQSAEQVYHTFSKRRIPVNIVDTPTFCDFSFASTHRVEDPTSSKRSSLQIGITTNGQGCRLSGRIRREIVARLPKDTAGAVEKVGQLRRMARSEVDHTAGAAADTEDAYEDSGVTTPNRPVSMRSYLDVETAEEASRRRMKWIAQISEYWSLSKLAQMSEVDMKSVLDGEHSTTLTAASGKEVMPTVHDLALPKPLGKIFLVGSGPGHPSLLTIATHTCLTSLADVVLSDKLVPSAVLDLIPKSVTVHIARKFPGNADGAQQELMELGVAAAREGKTVVRLKQGDPVVYGRAGEEVLYFRSHGIEPIVVPGVSSALAGPTFAGIPVTQRGAAESFVVCTGVGRKGKEVSIPGYERGRSLVLLMGVARLQAVVDTLVNESVDGRRQGPQYPRNLPISIIERASMPDQRVLVSTLEHVVHAFEAAGEQRPPGMIIVGWAVPALDKTGHCQVLDDTNEASDSEVIQDWLQGERWKIWEGIQDSWDDLGGQFLTQ